MIRTDTRELLFYGAASATAFATDTTVLWLLASKLKMHYLVAASASFAVGALVAYMLCIKVVFQFRRMETGPNQEFAVFAGIGAAGLIVNAIVMSIGISVIGLHLLIAKGASAVFTFALNFLLRKILLFSPLDAPATAASGDR